MTARSFRELAEMEQLIEEFAAGDIELDLRRRAGSRSAAAGRPHVVLRVVAVPMEVDDQARRVAAKRGVDVEDVLAEWVTAGRR